MAVQLVEHHVVGGLRKVGGNLAEIRWKRRGLKELT